MSDDFEIKNKRVWIQQGYQSGYEAGYIDGHKEGRPKGRIEGYKIALEIIRNEYMLQEAGYGRPTYNRYEEIFLKLINKQESI